MDIAKFVKSFFLLFTMIPIQLWHILPKLIPQSPHPLPSTVSLDFPSPQSPAALDPENTERSLEQQSFPQPITSVIQGQHKLDWTKLIIAFCFASAIQMATQTTPIQHPFLLHLLSLANALAFASFFVAKFIGPKFPFIALVLEQAGVFFAATAFFLAISLSSPLYIKCTTWAIYAASLVVIFICNHLY